MLLPLPGVGHLAHEEAPDAVARLLGTLPAPAV
jgi:magnesium chelatase accessory protein